VGHVLDGRFLADHVSSGSDAGNPIDFATSLTLDEVYLKLCALSLKAISNPIQRSVADPIRWRVMHLCGSVLVKRITHTGEFASHDSGPLMDAHSRL